MWYERNGYSDIGKLMFKMDGLGVMSEMNRED